MKSLWCCLRFKVAPRRGGNLSPSRQAKGGKKSGAQARQVGSLLLHSHEPGACSCFKNPSHLPAPASYRRHLSEQTLHPVLAGVPSCAARQGHKTWDGRGAGRGVQAAHPAAGRDGRGTDRSALPSLLRVWWNSRSGSPKLLHSPALA